MSPTPTVVLCLPSAAPELDPDPASSERRALRVVPVALDSVEALAAAVEQLGAGEVGLAGHGPGGLVAAGFAAARPELVHRLALVATPAPLEIADTLAFEPAAIAARTLLVFGSADPAAGSRHGRWWQQRLPRARLEMTPGVEPGRLLQDRWDRILSFLAPGSGR